MVFAKTLYNEKEKYESPSSLGKDSGSALKRGGQQWARVFFQTVCHRSSSKKFSLL
jgi:hypothetical protein